MELHIGVVPIPEPELDVSSGSISQSTTTTFEVAESLEHTYGLFSHFVEDNLDKFAELMVKNVQTSLHRYIEGEYEDTDLFDTSTNEITGMFRRYLDDQQLDKREAGVPTRAAMEGRRRLKGPDYKGPPRPSFIDTFTFYNSLRTWVEP